MLRKDQTDAEAVLWHVLRDRGLEGYRFRRQAPIGPYVADFLCESAMLIVEVDGGQHSDNRVHDEERSRFLEARGYSVIRFWNNEVLENLNGVVDTLTLTLSQREREIGQRAKTP